VFGLGFGELCVLVIVAIVVIGPKDMPRVLRKAGELAGKLRRMAGDVRAQSGIDDVLRADGLHEDIAEIRKLAQGDFLSSGVQTFMGGGYGAPTAGEVGLNREREYPREGADSYGATPDTAILYARAADPPPLATAPLQVRGEAEAPAAASDASGPPPAGPGGTTP
jgi:sec-independent protein translocase protein TatB